MGFRQKGIVKRADLEGQIEDIEVMPITWDECVLIGRTKPLSEVFTPKGGGVKENQVLAVAAVDDNGNPVAWKYTDGGGSSSGGKDYRIAETPSGEYAKSYKLQFKGGEDEEWSDAPESFVINVPKDMVVESGSVKTCTEADTPVQGYAVGDKYIDLVIANKADAHIYINVKDLVSNTADGISYDNTESGLDSENVQSAVDELAETKADKTEIYTKTQTDTAITNKVAEIVAGAPEDFDTLKEMSDWISTHEESAAAMNTAIQSKVGFDDLATSSKTGVVKAGGGLAMGITSGVPNGNLYINKATDVQIENGTEMYRPIVPSNLGKAMSVYGIKDKDYIKNNLVGVNLLPYSYYNTSPYVKQGITYTFTDGELSISGTANNVDNSLNFHYDNKLARILPVKATKYIIHVEGTNVPDDTIEIWTRFAKDDDTYDFLAETVTNGKAEIIIDNTDGVYKYIRTIGLNVKSGKTVNVTGMKIQLEEGDVAHEYRPYWVTNQLENLRENKADKTEILPTYTLVEYEEIKDSIPVGTKFAISDDEGGDTPSPSGGGLIEWFVIDDNHAISYDPNVLGSCVCNASGYNGSYAFMFGRWTSRNDGLMQFYGARDSSNTGDLVIKNGQNVTYNDKQVYIIAGFLKSDVELYNIQQITL